MHRGSADPSADPFGPNRLFFWFLANLPAFLHSPDLSVSEIPVQAGDDGLWG